MIILRDRFFASIRGGELKSMINTCEITICIEIMKIIEFYRKSPQDVRHWFHDKVVGNGFLKINVSPVVTPQMAFFGIDLGNPSLRAINCDELEIRRKLYGRSPEKYVEVLKKELINQGKYRTWVKDLKDFERTDEEYVSFFRYLALILSGEVNGGDYYDVSYKIDDYPLNFAKKFLRFDRTSISSILIPAINSILLECNTSLRSISSFYFSV